MWGSPNRRIGKAELDRAGLWTSNYASKRLLTPLSTPALDRASQLLFASDDNGTKELLIPDKSRGTVSKVTIRPTKASTFAYHRQFFGQAQIQTDKVAMCVCLACLENEEQD